MPNTLQKWGRLVSGVLISLVLLSFTPVAFAGQPQLNINQQDGGTIRLSISGADPYAQITLNQRQSGTSLWTTITNFGMTDQSGYFSTMIGLGSGSGQVEYYVVVNGQQSGIQSVYPNNNCYNNNCGGCNYYNNNCYGGQVTFSQSNITLNYSQSQTISIYGGYNNSYYVSNNSNSNVVTASITGSNLYIFGQNTGNSQITVCSSNSSSCGTLYVTVGSGNYNGNQITFSESSPTVAVGQSRNLTIYNNQTNYGTGYYISNNSNSNIASAYVSGSSLTINGINNGSTTVTVCATNQNCGYLYVNVVGYGSGYYYGSGSPYFTQTTLPSANSGQYYSFQLNATGGSYPYTYALSSGSLPSGLSLSYSGLLTGTPYCGSSQSFGIQVTDSLGRRGVNQFTLPISNCGYGSGYGTVYGSSIYKNGTLIKENGTVYIVYKNLKSGFTSASAFLSLGFKWENVKDVGYTGLISSNYNVSSSYSRHPWGSWVKSGNTVYFVHELGLIPVPSYEIFINNGGEDRLVVPANSYDFQSGILNPLEYGDSRLR